MPAKIAVIYWSLYGHVEKLAEEGILKGVKEGAPDAQVDIYQVAETLPQEVLTKMHAKPKRDEHPVFKPAQFADYDGFILGFGTRYGRAPAQLSALFDQTGGLWASGALHRKFGAVFTSTSSQHGGQETTALTTIPWFVHHGINYVPLGYAAPDLADMTEIVGGSAYGAAAVTKADGSRPVSAKEVNVAVVQGKAFAEIVSAYVRGKST